MNLRLSGKKMNFRPPRSTINPLRLFLLLTMLIGSLFLLRATMSGAIAKPFLPTPTPTRVSTNYALEGQTHFEAGNLPEAIKSYKLALQQDTENAQLWAELARIQTYSSILLSSDQDKLDRLNEALVSADRAVKVAPEDSMVHAVRAFVLDWLSSTPLQVQQDPKTAVKQLGEAEQESNKAITLDKSNALAHAYWAEIQTDQMRWTQAQASINIALNLNPNLMDVHRVAAYVWESLGDYNASIQEYEKAAAISKNLTFLYNNIARTKRQLRQYDQALEYYSKAVQINTNLQIHDPLPYVGIAKTYVQMGEFFAAALNVRKALEFDPSNSDLYGQLGIVYWHARNYEGSIPAFQCALEGCDTKTSCEVRKCDPATDPQVSIKGLPLTGSTVVYYYTYGSVMAAMHQKGDNLCDRALGVLNEVARGFPEDTSIMSIVNTSRDICTSYGVAVTATPTVSGTLTATPKGTKPATVTLTPSETPEPSETPLP